MRKKHFSRAWKKLVRGIPPSEVRVKITLEGTVRPGVNESCFEISTPNGGWATIGKDQIKDSDLKLVESLLKAQEEK